MGAALGFTRAGAEGRTETAVETWGRFVNRRLRAEGRTETAVENWGRFVNSAKRVRRLQRYFSHIGQFLQTFDSEFRGSLTKLYPKE
jgi:hypothetical protein